LTLVVAYCADDICFMVGDTLVTHAHFELKGDLGPVNGEFHSLKIQILSGSLGGRTVAEMSVQSGAGRGRSLLEGRNLGTR